MLLDTIANELAVALGLGSARLAIRWAWPRMQAWLRDFALTDPE